ncbi:hypothetical protein CHS0354_015517 [Potamilus streckersoni]|uniref:Uncharacterized protein n=1 Tax=Potamilus streckersoni TaxID=2493646 RepID=A0AAE0SF54_9BIVA|nr:hypothetical protein CHS0354_015517 [Potamilus streckersoni]
MSLLTARYRHKNKVFLMEENCQALKQRTVVDVKPTKKDPHKTFKYAEWRMGYTAGSQGRR